MENRKVILNLNHLNSIFSFERWIKKTVGGYDDKRVPPGELDKYLGYVERTLANSIGSNKVEWFNALKKIRGSIEDAKNK